MNNHLYRTPQCREERNSNLSWWLHKNYTHLWKKPTHYICYEQICDHWPDSKQACQFQNWPCACSSVQGDSNVWVIWMSGVKNCPTFLQEDLQNRPAGYITGRPFLKHQTGLGHKSVLTYTLNYLWWGHLGASVLDNFPPSLQFNLHELNAWMRQCTQ